MVQYIHEIHKNPQRFSGYILENIEGNLQRHGSAHVEQNHSSIVSHLGCGASWNLEDQVHKLLQRQDLLQKRKNEDRLKYQIEDCKDF